MPDPAAPGNRPVRLFCSYSHVDDRFRTALHAHTSVMRRQGLITEWFDALIVPGTPWEPEILAHLEASDIVLFLVSSDFLNSEFCWSVEVARSLERAQRRETFAIPVIVRPCDWKTSPLADLLALPRDGQPISTAPDADEAYLDVVAGLRRVVDGIQATRAPVSGAPVASGDVGYRLSGRVTDAETHAPVSGVCVTLGPPIRCFTYTDDAGRYEVNLEPLGVVAPTEWDLYFLKDAYVTTYSGKIAVERPTTLDISLARDPVREAPNVIIRVPSTPDQANAEEQAHGAQWIHFEVENTSSVVAHASWVRVLIPVGEIGSQYELVWPNRGRGAPLPRLDLQLADRVRVPLVMRGYAGLGYCPGMKMEREKCYVSGNELVIQCSTQGCEIAPGNYPLVVTVQFEAAGRTFQSRAAMRLDVPRWGEGQISLRGTA